MHTHLHTTVGALLDGDPVAALPCDDDSIALPVGQQELLISPGEAFVVDGAQLPVRGSAESFTATSSLAATTAWSSTRRHVRAPASAATRLLVVPESINPGWVAHTATGARLTPVAVNGWQQGWVVPAGEQGVITLTFASNDLYRAGLVVGLALLPLLAALALWRTRRRQDDDPPARPWGSGIPAAVALLGSSAVIAGAGGVAVVGAALGLRYALRRRQRLRDAATVALSAGGLILAGAALSRHPWRSVDGYAGHSPGVQLLALISLAAVGASAVTIRAGSRRRNLRGHRNGMVSRTPVLAGEDRARTRRRGRLSDRVRRGRGTVPGPPP